MIWTTPRGRKRLVGCSLALGLAASPAWADQPAASPAGRQVDPPGPEAPPEAPMEMVSDGRRAVRGCDPDAPCAGDLLEGLHAFEIEAFPRRRGDSPWSDRDGGSIVSRAPGAVTGVRRPVKPTALRPDLPWLARLEMPDLPIHWDHRIIKFLEFYKDDPRGQKLMRVWLRDQGRYKDLILRELRRARLPEDLLYVCMIESGYDSRDRSRVGATGLWQFMPSAGIIYGLRQTRWVDERNDPIRATRAVTAYFADLYQRFGDWDLAMAAYNAGYGAVLRGIARYNTNDFWRLLDYESALPWESSIYVPKALAAAIVGRNRELFGFGDVVPAPAFAYDEVTVPTSVGLSVVAKAAGVDTRAIEDLNPHLTKGRTPPGIKSFVVRIPRGKRDQFAARFAQLRGEWDLYDAYLVRHGERFEDVATLHGITVKKLRELNGMDSDREVEGGTVLVVPRVSEAAKQANRTRAEESLYSAGEPEGQPGEKLVVALPDPDFKVAGRQRVFYRVVAGDSLTRIARAFGVDRGQLSTWNGLDPEAKLQPRMVLSIWVARGFKPADRSVALLDPDRVQMVKAGSVDHIQVAEKKLGRERITYTAQKRESYEAIGKKYGLSARDVARINRKPYDTVLEAGDTCVIYQVVDRNASDRAAKQARQARPDRTSKKRPRK
jgi:membrane-bound lytic murein transglycosylase D